MIIVLLGSPASGKGTQAELIAKEFELYHLQTGEIARKMAKKDPRIREIVNAGKLIPEQEMTMYVIDYLKDNVFLIKDILFEGFPRFISQYEALSNFLETKGDDIDLIISLDISKEVAVKRISSRRICSECGEVYNLITNPPPSEGACKCGGKLIQRQDDLPESIEVRFQYYEDNTKELIDYLDSKGKLFRVNADRPIKEIFEDIKDKVKLSI